MYKLEEDFEAMFWRGASHLMGIVYDDLYTSDQIIEKHSIMPAILSLGELDEVHSHSGPSRWDH